MDIRRYFAPTQCKPKAASNEKKNDVKQPAVENKTKKNSSTKRPSVVQDLEYEEVASDKRLKKSKRNDDEDPLPPVRKTTSNKHSKTSKASDEDPLLPVRKTTSNKHSKTSKASDEDPLPPPSAISVKNTSSKKLSKIFDASDEDPLPSTQSKKIKNKPKEILEISDDEDPLPSMKKKSVKRKFVIEDSDDEVDFVQTKNHKKKETSNKASKVDEKKVVLNASDYFGSAPVKRSSIKNNETKQQPKTLAKEDFFDSENNNDLKSLKSKESVPVEKSESKSSTLKSENPQTPPKSEKYLEVTPKRSRQSVDKSETPKRSRQSVDKSETTPTSGKKGGNAASYQAYLNRSGPSALGSKEVPQGAENCFKGLTFVITGVLESFEREDLSAIILKYGGKVSQSISKNTSFMIIGREAGPAKLEKAEKLGTKQLTEDDFLDLIRSSLPKDKTAKANSAKNVSGNKDEKHSPHLPVVPKNTPTTMKIESSPVKTKSQNPVVKLPEIIKSKSRLPSIQKPFEIGHTAKPSADIKSTLMWVDKYKPTGTPQIIGQQGPRSNVQKLKQWLTNWFKNNRGSDKAKKGGFGKWGSDDGSNFKAALLSGSPGVGKTTTAQLVCKEAGFTFIELNASDTRSKKSMETIVAEMIHNKSLAHLIAGNSERAHNHCLLMDEVDGMAGNEDRGGVQQLIQLIKNSQIPIICMCNDRQHQKIRSLANYCFDLRFQKPSVESLKNAMMTVCGKEGIKISAQDLESIIIGANQDVRQVLHHLSMWTVNDKNLNECDVSKEAKKAKKDIKLNPFEAVRLVFSSEARKTMSIHDKSDLFFYDYSLSGLFVQENYLSVSPDAVSKQKSSHIDLVSKVADSICTGDLIEKLIRSEGHWNLLPTEAMFASVIPGNLVEGHLSNMINFPSWLGRNSTRSKNDRILQELHLHTRLRISGSKEDLNCDYLPFLRNAIVRPLVSRQQDGIQEAISVMNEYCLRKEDLDAIIDVCTWPKQENPLKSLSPQVKAAFTRAYNKESQCIPYAVATVSKKRVKTIEAEADDDAEDDNEEEEDITKDAMIKMKAPSKRKASKPAEPNTSSAGRGRKKGKTK
ncbi:replication factor C subunit 1 [Chamberlinius hualienensis]